MITVACSATGSQRSPQAVSHIQTWILVTPSPIISSSLEPASQQTVDRPTVEQRSQRLYATRLRLSHELFLRRYHRGHPE